MQNLRTDSSSVFKHFKIHTPIDLIFNCKHQQHLEIMLQLDQGEQSGKEQSVNNFEV